MADNAEIARQFYEAWNNRDFDFGPEHSTPDSTITMVGSGQVFHGAEGGRQFGEGWAEAFPDGRVTVDNLIAQGSCVVVEYTGRGTHTGTLRTPAGDIPATGRSVTLQFLDVLEFDGDKVRAQRTYTDTGSMMAQLGITAAAPATTEH
jgi:predicted ester cyclase